MMAMGKVAVLGACVGTLSLQGCGGKEPEAGPGCPEAMAPITCPAGCKLERKEFWNRGVRYENDGGDACAGWFKTQGPESFSDKELRAWECAEGRTEAQRTCYNNDICCQISGKTAEQEGKDVEACKPCEYPPIKPKVETSLQTNEEAVAV